MKTYTIQRAAQAVPLCGDASAGPWASADVARIDEFPWYKGGVKQAAEARVLYDDRALWLQFLCEDKHISAEVTETNGPVSKDSCVEFFATIEPDRGSDYFNIEVNCCGTRLMKWGVERNGRKLITPELARRIEVVTSIPGPTKAESPSDDGWWVAYAIPWDLLSEFTGRPVAPTPGTRWRANFYRCGGKTDRQNACWNPTQDYHGPQWFGDVRFA
jgi:hypothetical protein